MNIKAKLNRFTLTLILSCACFLGISQFQHHDIYANSALLAVEPPIEVASATWQNATFPVENFQSYTSPFGYRRSPVTGEVQFHNGIDMAAPFGSYIRNWWGGEIVKVAQDNTCGTHLIIESGPWQHSYCHLNGHVEIQNNKAVMIDADGGIQLVQGQSIPTGTRIGRVGMTGRTTGPHLHWVLKLNGSYIDPAVVIREMFGQKAGLDSEAKNIG